MKTEQEQRLQLRFAVDEDEGATGLLDLAPTREEVQIADLSLGGAGLVVPQPEFLYGSKNFQLGLRWPDWSGETPVDLVHVGRGANGTQPQVGVRFLSHGEDFLRGLCTYIVRAHSKGARRPSAGEETPTLKPTKDARRLRRTLLYCCRQRVRLRIYHDSGTLIGSFYPSGLSRSSVDGALDLLPGQNLVPGAIYDLVLHSFNSLYRFPVSLIQQRGAEAQFTMPNEMAWGATRYHARIKTGAELPIWLEFFHPQIPGKAVRKCAREVGFGGLSFALNVEEDVIAPGTIIESALLRLPGGRAVACRCVVRHSYRETNGAYACGIKILEFLGHSREAWFEHILNHLNPEVVAATASDFDDVWQVLHRSGYLEEKPLKGSETVRDDFTRVWSALTSTASTKCWIHRHEGQPLGTISASPLYSKSCLVHHLAVDRSQDAEFKLVVLGNLVYRTLFQWLASQHPDTNLIAYFSAERPFNKIAWFDFFDSQLGSPQMDKRQVNVFDCSTSGEALDNLDARLDSDIRLATASDIEWVSADLLQRDGAFSHRAFDYKPAIFDLDHLMLAEGAELQRRRILHVFGEPGEPLSYAICESSSRGANIFSLYDTCRLVIQSAHSGDFASVRDALFRAAAADYRQLGCDTFLVVETAGDTPPPPGYADFEAPAVRAIVGPDLIPKWAEYLNEIWAHRTDAGRRALNTNGG